MNLIDKLKIEKKTAIDFLKRELEILHGLMEEDIKTLSKEQFADLSDLDRHYDMVKFYRRRIGFLNEMMGLLVSEGNELKQPKSKRAKIRKLTKDEVK